MALCSQSGVYKLLQKAVNYSTKNLKVVLFVIQHHSQIQIAMSQVEQQIIKVQVYHQLIGNHNFEFSGKTHTSDLRLHILENSPLLIYENFHLEYQGARLQECSEISQIFKGDVRLLVVFDPYDQYSSRYHEMKVKKILSNPAQWMSVISRDYASKMMEEDKEAFPVLKLDDLFQDPFSSVFLNFNEKKESEFSSIINSSGFNPPSNSRKLLGDLYYLQIKTLEEVDFHVTANSQGFFVNQSSQGNFNPHPHPKYTSGLSLLALLFQISPKFKMKFQEMNRALKANEFQKVGQGERGDSAEGSIWMTERKCWKKGTTWKNDSYQYNYKNDYTVIKDWVQIFQYQLGSSSESLYEKIGKQKFKYRIYQEFIENVRECVLRIFNGTMKPLNTAAKMQYQFYYYSSLLFYFVNDGPKEDKLLPSGYSADKEILILSLIEQIETENVFFSHSAIISYRGYKIAAKAVPNSIIKADIEYNSLKDIFFRENKAQSDEQVLGAVRKICKCLGFQSENLIVDDKDGPKIVCMSPQLVACTSNDNKKFLLEAKIFLPRDLNFNSAEPNECFLRPQLIKIYNTNQKCSILYNSCIGTAFTLSNIEKYKQQHKKLQSVAKFAKEIMVPMLIDSFDGEMRKYLADSHSISYALHKYGLSSKYLDLICKKAAEKQAHHVKFMAQRAILIKSLVFLFNRALKQTPLFLHKTVVKHLFNCLFQQDAQNGENNHKEAKTDDETEWTGSKKTKKKKTKQNETCFEINFGKVQEKYCNIRKQAFWEELQEIALAKFKHTLASKSTFFQFQFSKIAILRDLCLSLGVIISKRDYFQKEGSVHFTEQNILNIIPKVKVIVSQPKELNDLIEEGDRLAGKFQIEQSLQAYNKAFQYIFSSFGQMHQKLGLLYKKFAGLHYKVGDLDAAILFALNSHQIYENLMGTEHVETIQVLMMIGVYQFGRKRFVEAEYYMLKAIFLAKFSYSECYPEVIVMHMNLSTVYEAQRKYTDAIMSLYMALNISIRVYGQTHLHTAIVFSALASLHYDIPDIEQTIKFQQRSIAILQQLLGGSDERVIEAKNTLEGYKNIQNSKKVRETHEKQQRIPFGLPPFSKFSMKAPYYDMRERATDFFWKKPRKLKYFF